METPLTQLSHKALGFDEDDQIFTGDGNIHFEDALSQQFIL